MMAMRQPEPACTIMPLCSEGSSPERTSDDLPQPEVPDDRQKSIEAQPPQQIVDLGSRGRRRGDLRPARKDEARGRD